MAKKTYFEFDVIDILENMLMSKTKKDFDIVLNSVVETKDHAEFIIRHFKRVEEEAKEYIQAKSKNKKDRTDLEEQLIEGLGHINAKHYSERIEELLKALNIFENNFTKSKKIRITNHRPETIIKRVKVRNYSYENLKPLDLRKCLKCKMLIGFNTKDHNITIYEGNLSFKGTKIMGCNSIKKKLIKDHVNKLQDLKLNGKKSILDFFDNLTTKEKVGKNTLNKNIILFKYF
jgi:hypothetical protein